MARIEDYWNDSELYNVQFVTTTNQKIEKVLVVNVDYTLKEIEQIILTRFNRVKRVNYIETMGECLALKSDKYKIMDGDNFDR